MRKIIQSILFFPSVTKPKIVLLLIITLTATVFEGFGVAMLFPVIDFIEKGKDFATLAASSRMWLYITKSFDLLSIPKTLLTMMSIVFGLLMIRQVFNYFRIIYSKWITENIFYDIRSSGFKWFAKADMMFYDTHTVGEIVNVLTMDGMRAANGIVICFNLMAASTIFSLYFIFIFILSPGMTLFAICIMGVVGIILKSRFTRSKEVGVEVSKYNEKISSFLVERFNGIRFLKLSATENSEAKHVNKISEKIKMSRYDLVRIKARMDFMVEPMVILAGLIILYFSIEIFHMTLAKTGIFIFILLRMMPYAKNLFHSMQELAGLSGSLLRVRDFLDQALRAWVIRGGNVTVCNLKRGIRFEDVSFRYNFEDSFSLEDINIYIPAGKMTALVGRSGAGKSTFVDLIPRLRVPLKGRITIDDQPIENFDLRALRQSIAFVPQEGFMFNDTIEHNIKYCRANATIDEVVKVAEMAFADHFIREMPNGYKTEVGERGVRLSGGQMQRIILARALLQKASIIILDEPTSALDSESEQFIQKAIERIRSEKRITMIIIAHRLSTIKSADQIIVLDKGKVIECGNHGELIHDVTWYANIVKMQAVG